MSNNIFFNKPLQQDDIFPINYVERLSRLTNMPTRKGLERAIISGGQIVNVVSNAYGHLPNEDYFVKVEEMLIEQGINYSERAINRENRSFSVDYILNDESYHVHIKNGIDKIRPMLTFTNSYDGSCRTSGHFGFFREVCHNGLHVATSKIGFSVKHTGNIANVVLPNISAIIAKFINNEFYELQKKFEVLAETPIENVDEFVKLTATELNLFKFASSEKNPDPSLNARLVADSIRNEANLLGTSPNLWHGYNAFNEILHGKLKKSFDAQKRIDSQIFEFALEMAN